MSVLAVSLLVLRISSISTSNNGSQTTFETCSFLGQPEKESQLSKMKQITTNYIIKKQSKQDTCHWASSIGILGFYVGLDCILFIYMLAFYTAKENIQE